MFKVPNKQERKSYTPEAFAVLMVVELLKERGVDVSWDRLEVCFRLDEQERKRLELLTSVMRFNEWQRGPYAPLVDRNQTTLELDGTR